MTIDFQLHRPKGFSGEGDQYLPEVIKNLKRRLGKAQGLLTYDTLHLPDRLNEELASVLVEYMEDIHNDIGIWRSYKIEIPIIDDFICQENTCWSGLGVIDILAATLNITEEQHSELRRWYERHAAYYKVLAIKDPVIDVMNVINDKPYTVRMAEDSDRFKVQQVIFGI